MKHKSWIQTLPCHCGDNTSTEAAHVRYSEFKSGKVNPGKGKKPADIWLVPLCSYHHRMQHSMGERTFWQSFSINPITYAILLHQYSGDISKLSDILDKCRLVN